MEEGASVEPYTTVVVTAMRSAGHLHPSELNARGRYFNSGCPGGRVIDPWVDTAAPVIGEAALESEGRVLVPTFDPQSFTRKTTYETPALGLAALAWRLRDENEAAVGSLE